MNMDMIYVDMDTDTDLGMTSDIGMDMRMKWT
jgi:hypothetical protein